MTIGCILFLLPTPGAVTAEADVIVVNMPDGYLTTDLATDCRVDAEPQVLRVTRFAVGHYLVEMELSSDTTSEPMVFAAFSGPIGLGELHQGWLLTSECPAWLKASDIVVRTFDCASGYVSIEAHGAVTPPYYYITASGSGICTAL